ncbi:ribosomal maturation YjgA family protein [Streptomyces sp. NPDC001732]
MYEDAVAGTSRTALRARAVAAGSAVLTVLAGLGVRAFMDGDIAKYAGDALYTVLVCALVAVIAPGARPVVGAGTALAFSWAVELLQLTGVPADLSRHSAVARLVLGSTFNAPDLFWYVVGAGVAWAVMAAAASAGRAPRASASRRPRRPR